MECASAEINSRYSWRDVQAYVVPLAGVVAYNITEASPSRLRPERVVRRNFFREIAPCAAVGEFAGELGRMRSLGVSSRSELRFLFKFPHGAVFVPLAMIYDAPSDTTVLLVKPLAAEADTHGQEGRA
jgi:hypothetical protein